jgi:hemolysin activation/secretion protein
MHTISRFCGNLAKPLSLACLIVMLSWGQSRAADQLAANAVRRPAEIQQEAQVSAELVTVNGFSFTGNTAIGTLELQPLLAGYVGQACGLEKLRQAADRVTAEYHRRGMTLATAYIPPQQIEGGIVTIAVVEGRIGQIMIEGNKNYSASFIRRFLTAGKTDESPTVESLEKGLLLLNSNFTDLKVIANIVPGREPGTSDVHIKVEDKTPLHLTLSGNNYGSKYVSRMRYSAQADWVNALSPGAHMVVGATLGEQPKNMKVFSGSYEIPVNSDGTMFGITGYSGNFEVGKDFAELGIHNKENSEELYISHPLLKRRLSSLTGKLGFRAADAKFYLLDEISKKDNTRVVYAQIQADQTFLAGRSLFDLTLSKGLGTAMGGSGTDEETPVSRQNASNDFYRINAGFLRLQPFNDVFSTLVRVSVQWTTDNLLAGEEWLIGGVNSVHGYTAGEASGDKGYSASLSLRAMPLEKKELLQLAAYLDYGYAYKRFVQIGSSKKNDLAGVGFGVSTHVESFAKTDLRLDVGFPLKPSENYLKESPIVYLETAFRF